MTCDQCGTRTPDLTPSEHGRLCLRCAFAQDERSEHGYGLAPGTFGFLSETE